MVKAGLMTFAILVLLGAVAWSQEEVVEADSSNLVYLKKATCTVRTEGLDSIVEYRLSFGKQKAPQCFYEINRKEKTITMTMGYARCRGVTVSDSFGKTAMGPVRSIEIKEDLQNKNQDMPTLLPIWYNVIITTIRCDPIIKDRAMATAMRDEGGDIIVDFKWPASIRKRAKLYDIPRTGFKIAVASVAAVCAAGIAAGAYYYYKHYYHKKKEDILEPVLPEHPSPLK
jgi:hypothetical protein